VHNEGVVQATALPHLGLIGQVVKVVVCGESQNNDDLSVHLFKEFGFGPLNHFCGVNA